ncbi:MAG: metallophosphoesterase [Deltaproteobacteria bacterium]|nr:metallophosphoesterase [Deltaproteobacteria bacterium]
MTNNHNITRRRFLCLALAAVPCVSATKAIAVERERLKVNMVSLNEGSARCRYIHFSDLHFTGDSSLTRKVIDEFRILKPDFACFTGDLIESEEHKRGAFAFISALGCPVYGIPGNHDYQCRVPFAEFARAFAATGGAWLEDRSILAAKGRVEIVGLAGMSARTIGRSRAAHRILLTHYPLAVDTVGGNRFTVVLAGHSHGGQVRAPLFGPLYLPRGVGRYDLGRFETRAGTMYVSAGLGTSMLPLRINCQPDITLFNA